MDAGQVTMLLKAYSSGDSDALDRLVPLVYDELRAIAHHRLRSQRDNHTLNTTALVHELYVKLANTSELEMGSRTHFLATASRMMRFILVDYAKMRNAIKRGGNMKRVDQEDIDRIPAEFAEAVLDLNDALERLEKQSPRQGQVIEQRFFGGLSVDETAEVLGISSATVKRDLRFARAWLSSVMTSDPNTIAN